MRFAVGLWVLDHFLCDCKLNSGCGNSCLMQADLRLAAALKNDECG
ncbi:hypothetical protein QUB05_12490 [Microcoleus sp. F10-C6]